MLTKARRLQHVFEASCDARPESTALVCGTHELSYFALDRLSNQLASSLTESGIGPGARVATVLERSVAGYAGHLALLKMGAALVPIDLAMPPERARFIADDAAVDIVLHSSTAGDLAGAVGVPTIDVDDAVGGGGLADRSGRRPFLPHESQALCYVIYTSGSTGTPKGVAVSHDNICNYLGVVPDVYGVTSADRVCQGMSMAFDFAMEEIWVTWAVGATLVAAPTDASCLGSGLVDFLARNRITVLCAVPTLLATVEEDAPTVRTLIVGGENCPPALVRRWARPGRRVLNTYGPTETTITATWKELRVGEPVTIGRALPTYQVNVMDDQLRPVNPGDTGEICIGGPGVAMGYLNRPDLEQERFVPDPVGTTPGQRLYRSGDLGRQMPCGDIEFVGRNDGQVKIRGYLVNLAEVEAVLVAERRVSSAVVATFDPGGNAPIELVAYVVPRSPGSHGELLDILREHVRRHLPSYMVPASIEVLRQLPTRPSGKVDLSALPAPRGRRLGPADERYVAPEGPLEAEMAEIWAEVLGCGQVSVEADFFDELGGHSLLAARVVSRLRRDAGQRGLSIADLYSRPTVRGLAGVLEKADPEPRLPEQDHHVATKRARSWLTFFQLLTLYLMLLIPSAPIAWLVATRARGDWVSTLVEIGLLLPCMTVAASVLLPIWGLRLAAPRLRAGKYRLWSGPYLWWWVCRKLLGVSPLRVLSGSPLAAPYLRALGGRVGRHCHLGTSRFDLPFALTIGDGASIGYGAVIQPYIVEDGWLTIAAVTIGPESFVGANSVLLAGGRVGPGATVTEHSLVGAGVVVPGGEAWSGSPAAPVVIPDDSLAFMGRAAVHTAWTAPHVAGFVAGIAMLYLLPYLTLAAPVVLIAWAVSRCGLAAGLAATLLAGPVQVLGTCVLVLAGHRAVNPAATSGIYPARSGLGLRKWASDKLIESSLSLTNALFGTLYTPIWLRLLGAQVGARAEVSTVANIDPSLLRIGAETFVADLASVGGARYHRGMIAVGPTVLEHRSFVGNGALVRPGTRLGAGALIGVHTPAPPGEVSAGTAWLGSPPIPLPRREVVEGFPGELTYSPSRRRFVGRLAIEYVRVTLPATVSALVALVVILAQLRLAAIVAPPVLVALTPVLVLLGGLFAFLAVVGLKWAVIGRYRPRVAPLWSWFVRRTELVTGAYEALAVPAFVGWMTGTLLMGPLLRILGADVGKDVWLETTFLSEFDLVHVSDEACIGELTSLQTHLFEDRVLKMSHLSVGARATIGCRSVLLYDSEVGPRCSLDALSLVMKGEHLTHGRWRGIPARSASSTATHSSGPV